MNFLLMTLSITFVQLPALFLRYLPFSKLVTSKTRRKLVAYYGLCFSMQNIILYIFMENYFDEITPLSYKMVVLFFSMTYVAINIIVIKGYFYQHLFTFNMQGGYSLFIHSLVAVMLGNFGENLPLYKQFLIQTSIYTVLFIIFTIPLWNRIKDSALFNKSTSHHYFWNIIWLIPMLAVYSNSAATLNKQWINSWQQLLSRFIMAAAISLSWKFININFEKLNKILALENTNKMLFIQNEAIESQANIICENNKKISIFKHDMRHNLLILSSLIEGQKYAEASSLITTLSTSLQRTKSIMFCKNGIINSAIIVYITRAEKYNIQIKTDINIPSDIPWDDHDIAILFANALENAVIASKNQDAAQREIYIEAKFDDKKLGISIRNRFADNIMFNEAGFPVTEKANHGIGIQSIMAIIEKYKAHVSVSHEKGWFTISFLFSESFS